MLWVCWVSYMYIYIYIMSYGDIGALCALHDDLLVRLKTATSLRCARFVDK